MRISNFVFAAVVGAALLPFSMAPASAFSLSSPSIAPSVAGAQIEDVYYYRHGYYPYRYGGHYYHHRRHYHGHYRYY